LDAARWNRDPEPVLALARRLRAEVRARPPLRTEDLAVDGRDLIALGLKPGPRFGRILDALMERVLEDPGLNRRDSLLALVEEGLAGEE
jgi:tRNA nucleotidyltransferase (CCA-adding enzyme)